MALSFDGVSPTEIIADDIDVTKCIFKKRKTGEVTSVWGKPFSLIIDKGNNVSLTVTRQTSHNEHASIGTLSSGDVIYYGDVIYITSNPAPSYRYNTFTINGESVVPSDASVAVTKTITVTGAIDIVVSAESRYQTVWSGSTTATSDKSTSFVMKDFTTRITIPQNTTLIRITGSYKCVKSGITATTTTFSAQSYNVTSTAQYITIYSGKVQLYAGSGTYLRACLAGTALVSTTLTLNKVEAFL